MAYAHCRAAVYYVQFTALSRESWGRCGELRATGNRPVAIESLMRPGTGAAGDPVFRDYNVLALLQTLKVFVIQFSWSCSLATIVNSCRNR